ncbi:uncharacterized protein BCR38DRAFT_526961 [Pseudomassariella vexata]|uniref:Armadillo-type protein n=1 Tax=Pseudomassariella vexata TaxID=1141098 RepID=A0A1Y2DKA6_9PEZI|nr:uncharacterized protein BCR38DRAFT_526961 [Pseudomassariella vexata]ORY59663.1 hypothetical protein BCR38DRAFT_526961 [Pseudomassariella vexata]
MFDELLKISRHIGQDSSPSDIPREITSLLPSSFTLEDVSNMLIGSKLSGDISSLRAIQACLGSEKLTSSDGEDPDALQKVAKYVARSILPVSDASLSDGFKIWKNHALKAEVGLDVLHSIDHSKAIELDDPVFVSITAFTSVKDSWTTETSSSLAHGILKAHLQVGKAQQKFIVETVLNGFLRPLFSKSRPATVTASGRKAEFVEASRYAGLDAQSEAFKQWKHSQRYAITVFEWAVVQADEELLRKHWHMFTPVLLTLLDESETEIKIRAITIFTDFWARCPAGLMRKVGLAEVFEQAIFPAVLYLPSLTPEDESVRILNTAYPALFQLAGLPYPEKIDEPCTYPEFSKAEKQLLDKIIREGILVGHNHASEYVRLTELFLLKARYIVNGMGILAVKHLKDFIPMVSQVMIDPFGTKYPPVLHAGARLLQVIMRCCWPRMPGYCDEVVKVLTVCALNIEDEDAFPEGAAGKEKLKSELMRTADMLSAVIKAEGIDLSKRVIPLIEKEPSLAQLFTEKPKQN